MREKVAAVISSILTVRNAVIIISSILILSGLVFAVNKYKENGTLKMQVQNQKELLGYYGEVQGDLNARISVMNNKIKALRTKLKEKNRAIEIIAKKRREVSNEADKETGTLVRAFTDMGYPAVLVSR